MPDGVDREKIAVDFVKGVLTITMPKTAKAGQRAEEEDPGESRNLKDGTPIVSDGAEDDGEKK